MKRLFRRFKERITFKELPPPYRESEDCEVHRGDIDDQPSVPAYEVIDLLANCKIAPQADDIQESDADYAEIREMGLWHSTPLAHRHKSKVSLTWVLKENLENTKLPAVEKIHNEPVMKKVGGNVDLQHQHWKPNENERRRKCKYIREVKDRVVGRNEYYHDLKFRNACDNFVNDKYSHSDDSSVNTEYTRKKHRHRHRRKKKCIKGKFGYDIRDLDSFLSEASIDKPGNIPVVVAYPTTLYQTGRDEQRELTLPLGTVVNAVFKNHQWLYVQTPHTQEGYVMYNACLPLGILPNKTSAQKKTPCWESSTDIYPRPCGNLTDTEKEQMRGRTRSECHYRLRTDRRKLTMCAERNFDTLYLKTKSVSNIRAHATSDRATVKRHTLMVVNSDYKGSPMNRTLTVNRGDVVVLMQGTGVADVDADWFYVKNKNGSQGFIPAAIAGHGYI